LKVRANSLALKAARHSSDDQAEETPDTQNLCQLWNFYKGGRKI